MRLFLISLFFISFFAPATAQTAAPLGEVAQRIESLRKERVDFRPVSLFTIVAPSAELNALWNRGCREAEVLNFNEQAAQALLVNPSRYIAFTVPSQQGDVIIDLEQANILADDFVVRIASTGGVVRPSESVHYRGSIRGQLGSIASISIFPEGVMGLLSDQNGERILGRFDQAPPGLHVFYHERDLLGTANMACATVDEEAPREGKGKPVTGSAKSIRCVRWYWEVANDIFLNKGSVALATNYVTGIFNQSATLYANDGVNVSLLEVFVWDVASPYNGASSGSRLSQFGTTRTSFNGDMAHLLDLANYGGVAWLNTLCGGTSSRMAYSGIDASYNNVPTYSWSVMVVSHEQGHNLGSPHTHACSWNGNNTAIDGCGPTAGYTEGSCPTAPLPAGGGTIMSYCHLIGGTGINLANGFGPQPKALILSRVNASSCLLACGTSCDPPSLFVSALQTNSCTLNWSNVGAVSYSLRWKAQASGTWTNVNGLATTTYALTGLAQAVAYEFQVLSVCGSATSAYSASTNFTTPIPCPDAMEPNNTLATAATITLPASVSALIATNSDQDYYSFTLASASNVNLSMSNLAADYDLYLLSSAGTVLASGVNGGTTNESINYSAVAGSYVLRAVGYNGAFSATQCYALSASAYASQTCGPVLGLNANNITYNSALLGWNAALTASTYDLQWKTTAGSVWTTVTGLATNSYPLAGLTGSTSYTFQVKPNCAGSQSGYGEPSSFTTSTTPCEVAPPILVAVKALLEGPYKTANSLMTDSLRKQNVLPLTESYTAAGLAVTGATTISASVLTTTGANAIVDWVVVELRNAGAPATVVERKAALLQRDGDVVALDGTSALGFCSAAGNYYVAVRHRNHFGCMTSGALALGSSATTVDFKLLATGTYGTEPRKTVGSVQVLWAGNATGDVNLQYTGAGNDRDPILIAVGSTTPNNTISGYLVTDVNMDGIAKYIGTENDRDPILINVGNTTPNSVRVQQLP